jgi:hypothetical protein
MPEAKARSRTRTDDPFLTMEVLYQLSYPGADLRVAGLGAGQGPLSATTKRKRPGRGAFSLSAEGSG